MEVSREPRLALPSMYKCTHLSRTYVLRYQFLSWTWRATVCKSASTGVGPASGRGTEYGSAKKVAYCTKYVGSQLRSYTSHPSPFPPCPPSRPAGAVEAAYRVAHARVRKPAACVHPARVLPPNARPVRFEPSEERSAVYGGSSWGILILSCMSSAIFCIQRRRFGSAAECNSRPVRLHGSAAVVSHLRRRRPLRHASLQHHDRRDNEVSVKKAALSRIRIGHQPAGTEEDSECVSSIYSSRDVFRRNDKLKGGKGTLRRRRPQHQHHHPSHPRQPVCQPRHQPEPAGRQLEHP